MSAGILARAGSLLNKLIPTGLAIKGLSKIDPRLSNFISNAGLAGYSADSVLDYLRTRLNPGQAQSEKELEAGAASGGLHPEQKVSLKKRREENAIGKGLAGAIGLATGLGSLSGNESMQRSSQQPPPIPPPELQSQGDMQRVNALNKFNKRSMQQKEKSLLNAQGLEDQFEQRYGDRIQQDNADEAILAALDKILKM